MSNDGTLPQEILTDVLSQLPVKSLCRFKCVSRSWKTLISDPHFAKTHLNRTNTKNPKYPDPKIILTSIPHYLYYVDFANVNPIATKLDFPALEQHDAAGRNWFRVWGFCNGLLLVSNQGNSNSFFLLNPSTRECKKLPTPPTVLSLGGFGFGYDSSTDDYKVVRLFSNGRGIMVVAVYSLKTSTWRVIQESHYDPVEYSRGVIFNGCLHYPCSRRGYCVIIAFNISDEILREVSLPASFRRTELLDYSVAVVGGCLSLLDSRLCFRTEVWMMEEYGVGESWTKLTIDFSPGTPSLGLLCQLADDKFLFLNNRSWQENKFVVYDRKEKTPRDMAVAGIPSNFTIGHMCVESLVSPNLGGIGMQ